MKSSPTVEPASSSEIPDQFLGTLGRTITFLNIKGGITPRA